MTEYSGELVGGCIVLLRGQGNTGLGSSISILPLEEFRSVARSIEEQAKLEDEIREDFTWHRTLCEVT